LILLLPNFITAEAGLTQVAKAMNIAVQSVLRGVERGEEEFHRREWVLADFL
jgi:hypothetical protein